MKRSPLGRGVSAGTRDARVDGGPKHRDNAAAKAGGLTGRRMRQLRVPVTMSPRALTRLGASPAKMEKSCLARSKCRYFTPADNTGVSWTSAPPPALQPAID